MVDALCDAMERVGGVWPIGHKVSYSSAYPLRHLADFVSPSSQFATMVSGDRIRLAERTYQRDQQQHAQHQPTSSSGTGGGGSNQNTPVSQSSQHLHPHHQTGFQTSPTLHSDSGY